jgi:abhydrolase domain-containing protein 12
LSRQRLANFIRASESNNEKYRLTIIHAEDDFDIPSRHTQMMFWHAVNAMISGGITFDELELRKNQQRIELGAAGSVMEWQTDNGVVREEILKTGLHDVVMGYPVVTLAVMRILAAADPSFA